MKIWLIIFLVLTVSHRVQSQSMLVVNTTCLELAKPSNQQLRLSCRQYDYHCLLDETFTKEFEVCREWKWIPGGKCAYFNTYGSGNVDERKCIPGINLTCSQSKHQFESNKNTQYSACYAKKESDTPLLTTTSLIQVTPNMTSDTATSSPISRAWIVFLIFIGIAFSLFMVMLLILRSKPLYQKDEEQNDSDIYEDAKSNQQNSDQESLLNEEEKPTVKQSISQEKLRVTETERNGKKKSTLNGQESLLNEEEKTVKQSISQEKLIVTETERNDKKKDKISFLNEGDKTTDNNSISQEKLKMTETERSGENVAVSKESDNQNLSVINEKDSSYPPSTSKVSPGENVAVSKESDNQNLSVINEKDSSYPPSTSKVSPEGQPEVDKGKISEKDNGGYGEREDNSRSLKRNASAIVKSNVENDKDEEESTNVFDGTVEKTPPPTDEQGRELCTHLYNQLHTEGLKLTQEVMAATITRETGKSVETLLTNLTDQDRRKLKEELPEESYCGLESKNEHELSFFKLYGLYRIFLEIKHHPKSGWGNPIKETDVGIGDDIERFYMIHDFVRGISDPMEVPIKSYIRRLDIMLEALTRLDHYEKFKNNLTAFAKEISCFKTVLHL